MTKESRVGGLIVLSLILLTLSNFLGGSIFLFTLAEWLQCSSGIYAVVFEESSAHRDEYLRLTFRLTCLNFLSLLLVLFGASKLFAQSMHRFWLVKIGLWLLSGYGVGRYVREKDERLKEM